MFYFLLNSYNSPNKANYQHSCILLAEGLKKMGYTIGGNIDYFPDQAGNYTICKAALTNQTYIITSSPEDFADDIKQILQTPKRRLIIIDTKDEWVRSKSTQFLTVAHRYFMSTATIVNNTIRPWVFGITQRLIDSASPSNKSWSEREAGIVWAHRVGNHQLRNIVNVYYKERQIHVVKYLDEYKTPDGSDLHNWNHSGRRHSKEYFEFIGKHRYIDAHGGYSINRDQIVQWDSWKIWEGFLAGCLVITADLDYYKIKLPFPLIPFEHYIPIRYDQLGISYDKLFSMSDIDQAKVASAGRKYILEHYTPENLTKYMLNNVDPTR